jgi:uncharacterized protein (DUF111 family)
MEKKKFNTDEFIIEELKKLPPENNASMFVHTIKDGEKNYISYFLEANVDDLSTMLYKLLEEPGFKSAIYRALMTHFQMEPEEKDVLKAILNHIDNVDIANMN